MFIAQGLHNPKVHPGESITAGERVGVFRREGGSEVVDGDEQGPGRRRNLQ